MKIISIFSLLFLLPCCSSCSSGDGSKADSGQNTDTDTDTDTDNDTDIDTDTDTDTDIISDAGPWDWEDLPQGEDCGTGCAQLTFTKTVDMLEWDVWGSLLAYTDGDTTETWVVDYVQRKQVLIPNFYPDVGIGPSMGSLQLFPATVYEKTVCYAKSVFNDIGFSDIICADLDAKTQRLVYHRIEQGGIFPNPAKYSDLYGNRFVSMGGCGEVMDSWPLCAVEIDSPAPVEPQQLTGDFYGGYNSIWGDVVVFQDARHIPDSITGYDFSTSQFIEITADDEYQLDPRIQGTKAVYHDLRYGDSDNMGSWNHSAVFVYDLETKERTQITNAEWIAAYPDVYGDIVIWADYRACSDPNQKNDLSNVEIWGYNLVSKQEFQITNLPGRVKTTPRIWEDKVFVHMYKENPAEDAIYMFDLPEGTK
jgi:beta propeller repeat protein